MEKILTKYPDRVPVIIESKVAGDDTVLKLMVPRDRTMGSMIVQLRNKIKMSPKQGMYLFVNGVLPPNSSTVGQMWELHKNPDDKVLHIQYSLENTFG
jgi:hypothetical protein